MVKNLSFDMYTIEPTCRRFKSLFSDAVIKQVFEFLATEEAVNEMIKATKSNRPALEGVIESIENRFLLEKFDIDKNYKYRQITGSMIRYIMGHYGYMKNKSKPLKKGNYIKTAIVYKRFEAHNVKLNF